VNIRSRGRKIYKEGINRDLRVEGDTKDHLLFVDAGVDRVGIGISLPTAMLHVEDTFDAGVVAIFKNLSTTGIGAAHFDTGDDGQDVVRFLRNGTEVGAISNASSRFNLHADSGTNRFVFHLPSLTATLLNDSNNITWSGGTDPWRLLTGSEFIAVTTGGIGINEGTLQATLHVQSTTAARTAFLIEAHGSQSSPLIAVNPDSEVDGRIFLPVLWPLLRFPNLLAY